MPKLQVIERELTVGELLDRAAHPEPPVVYGEFLPAQGLSVERRSYRAAIELRMMNLEPPGYLATPSARQNWTVDKMAEVIRRAFE